MPARHPLRSSAFRLLYPLLLTASFAACVSGSADKAGSLESPASISPSSGPVAPEETPTVRPELDPRSKARRVRANELGVIPVLMYHRVRTDAAGDYDITPAAFRRELTFLWREGYVPVRAADLAEGNLDVPAGKSPVVLTFDDSSSEQFAYTKAGRIDSGTAIGILIDFAATHRGFPSTGSLYLNERPFNSSDYPKMLRDLHERGFELGNHTLEHRDLRSSSATEVQRQLALGKKLIADVVPDAEVTTLSLPLGISPEPARLAVSGRWQGLSYRHEGVLLVGSNPAPSPFSRSFDPSGIPRIRSARQVGETPTYGSEFWLERLKKDRGGRYISDGDPETIAFPKKLRPHLDRRFVGGALPY